MIYNARLSIIICIVELNKCWPPPPAILELYFESKIGSRRAPRSSLLNDRIWSRFIFIQYITAQSIKKMLTGSRVPDPDFKMMSDPDPNLK